MKTRKAAIEDAEARFPGITKVKVPLKERQAERRRRLVLAGLCTVCRKPHIEITDECKECAARLRDPDDTSPVYPDEYYDEYDE